jgi:acyl dehydratase
MTTTILRESGRIRGPIERPRNIAANRVGSIHDEDMARKLGFGGALVSGRVHLNVFVPLLMEAFGQRWFERGTISLEFRSGTFDQEEVIASIDEPPPGATDVQVSARLERPDGSVVAIGTASVGDSTEPTWLATKNPAAYDLGGYELVANVTPGDRFPEVEHTPGIRGAERMAESTVALPWYTSESPWGAPIASPALMVGALGAACGAYLRDHPISGVAIDGTTELRNINGPILIGHSYRVSGEVIARGRSPRTEYFWYEARMDDESGRRIAEMRLQWRCMPRAV